MQEHGADRILGGDGVPEDKLCGNYGCENHAVYFYDMPGGNVFKYCEECHRPPDSGSLKVAKIEGKLRVTSVKCTALTGY